MTAVEWGRPAGCAGVGRANWGELGGGGGGGGGGAKNMADLHLSGRLAKLFAAANCVFTRRTDD